MVLGHACLPTPWWPHPGFDAELERLQRLQRERQQEEEKERLRQWLRRHGVPEDRINPGRPWPCVTLPPCRPFRPSVNDVLRRVR